MCKNASCYNVICMAVIGIDLGTTNSIATYVDKNGEIIIIPDVSNGLLVPSCVGLDDDKNTILIGNSAKNRLVTKPDLTVSSFKRFMGTEKKYKLANKEFTPIELSSLIIKYLCNNAKEYLNEEITEAIISVPAYFDDNGRNATKIAGQLAGIKVERIINEPSSAALAYRNNKQEESKYIVFDFGGGTLDISIVETFENIIEISAVSGDNHLGGNDIDKAIFEYFCNENNLDINDLNPKIIAILMNLAEKTKISLNDQTEVTMSYVVNERECNAIFTNSKLVEICAFIFERIKKVIVHALHDCPYGLDEFSGVIMVGGSSKMKSIQGYIVSILGLPILNEIEPNLVVAIGAGLVSGIKERKEQLKDFILTDVCPFSLGVDILNPANPKIPLFSPVIQRNTSLPASIEKSYTTASDFQEKMIFQIYQGESIHAIDNLKLGELSIDVPRLKKGKVVCNVRLTYDINGILEVDIECENTKEQKRKVILNKNIMLTDEEIEEKKKELSKIKIMPIDEEQNKIVIERIAKIYEEVPINIRDDIESKYNEFLLALDTQDRLKIEKMRKRISEYLDDIEQSNNVIFNDRDYYA